MIDYEYSAAGQGFSCNCPYAESRARDLKIVAQQAEEVAQEWTERFNTLYFDRDNKRKSGGETRWREQLLADTEQVFQLTRSNNTDPIAGLLSLNGAIDYMKMMTLMISPNDPRAELGGSLFTPLAYSVISKIVANRTYFTNPAIDRLGKVDFIRRIKTGNKRFALSEIAYLDSEAASLEAQVAEQRELQAVLMAAATARR
ncbi:hypothetical protein A3709_19625 [Halioglobus sp. HI00S01]|nr:hypothetical protein A3709_19625 [Halioglobus sp. HI00S01]